MLTLQIGPFPYRVLRTEAPIVGADGERLGEIDYDRREIYIAGDCPQASVAEVLAHELAHAWLAHMPMPKTEEELCDFAATVAWGFARDLERHGGSACLLTLGMQERIIAPADIEHLNPTDRVDAAGCACSVCGQAIAPASIIRSGPARHDRIGTPVVHLKFYCGYCEELQVWTELATPGGLPSGVVVDQPVHRRGQEVDDFCRAYPRETGVLMA